MANIYNETMIKLYKYGVQDSYSKSCYDGGLYKGYMFEKNAWGGGGYYSKNCSYGYAHYNPTTNRFVYTLGYKGFEILDKWFKLKQITPEGLYISWEEEGIKYAQMIKDLKLKYDWYEIDLRTKQAKKLKEKLKSAVMLYFKI